MFCWRFCNVHTSAFLKDLFDAHCSGGAGPTDMKFGLNAFPGKDSADDGLVPDLKGVFRHAEETRPMIRKSYENEVIAEVPNWRRKLVVAGAASGVQRALVSDRQLIKIVADLGHASGVEASKGQNRHGNKDFKRT